MTTSDQGASRVATNPAATNWYQLAALRPIAAWQADTRLDPTSTALVVIDLQYGSASRHAGIGRRMQEEGRAEVGAERFDRIEQLVVPNTLRLLEAFRRSGGFIVYLTINSLRHDFRDIPRNRRNLAIWRHAGQGMTDRNVPPREHAILDEIAPQGDDLVLNKTTIGGFSSSNLHSVLRSAGIATMIVCGVSTNSCIESTVRGAADRGFRVVLAEDACGAAAQAFHDAAVVTLDGQFSAVAATIDLVEALRSGAAGQGS